LVNHLKKKIINCSIAKFTTRISSLGWEIREEFMRILQQQAYFSCLTQVLPSKSYFKAIKGASCRSRSLLSRKIVFQSSFPRPSGVNTLIFSVLNVLLHTTRIATW
jgi:hypothetical protein